MGGRRYVDYKPRKYILNFAETIVGQLSIQTPDHAADGSAADVAKIIFRDHCEAVRELLSLRHSPSTLGKIAACGIGEREDPHAAMELFQGFHGVGVSMAQAYGDSWLNEYEWGFSQLLNLATATLLAAIADVIFARALKAEGNRLRESTW